MFCDECGKELRPNAKFCPHCGAPRWAAPDAQKSAPEDRGEAAGGAAAMVAADVTTETSTTPSTDDNPSCTARFGMWALATLGGLVVALISAAFVTPLGEQARNDFFPTGSLQVADFSLEELHGYDYGVDYRVQNTLPQTVLVDRAVITVRKYWVLNDVRQHFHYACGMGGGDFLKSSHSYPVALLPKPAKTISTDLSQEIPSNAVNRFTLDFGVYNVSNPGPQHDVYLLHVDLFDFGKRFDSRDVMVVGDGFSPVCKLKAPSTSTLLSEDRRALADIQSWRATRSAYAGSVISTAAAEVARPPTPRLLYAVNWSRDRLLWRSNDPLNWGLTADGIAYSGAHADVAVAPVATQGLSSFAVEATINAGKTIPRRGTFGVVIRGPDRPNGDGGVFVGAGRRPDGSLFEFVYGNGKFLPSSEQFVEIGGGWHTYRVEVRGDTITLLVDGVELTHARTNISRSLTGVGLWSTQTPIVVRDFRVESL